ncbi:MAG: zinc-binding dehydrogenase [Chloroflexi bacterium]|nr:zinc-binding dehydrogenase [Chloroflexota bacterium]
MAISTRGLVFAGAGRPLEIESLRLDEPQSGEVLIRMVASGVCHSDLHVMDGDWERPANVVLGHEGAAIVEALGPDVPSDAVREGDLVVLAWTAPCRNCIACARAEPWLCGHPRGSGHRLREDDVRLRRTDGASIGVYSGIGTFGERQVVAYEAAIPIDPATPPELAALIGCAVTTGFGAVVITARVRAGESVVIIGAGGVGLSAVMGARFADADPIVVMDTNPEKLELARRAGATHVFQPPEADGVGILTDGGPDHVLEAIGLTETVEQAIELVRPGGIVTLVGMTPQGQRAGIDVYRFVEDGKQLRGSNYGSANPAVDFPRIAALYLDGRLPLDLLVTERIGLESVESALEAMRRGDGARRVVVY